MDGGFVDNNFDLVINTANLSSGSVIDFYFNADFDSAISLAGENPPANIGTANYLVSVHKRAFFSCPG
jgi:hypothetical protein